VKTIDGIPPPGSSGGATEYSYPTGNRLDHSTGHETANHTYDNNGNITSDGTFTFVYNQNNRLSEVKIGNAAIARYAYDGFGRRVKKEIVASGVIVHYHYDLQSNLLAESGGDGTPLRDYIYQNGNLIAIKIYGDQAGIYYVIYDHPGTPQQIVNTSGTVVWKAAYLPFGQAQILVETITCNIRFPGQYYDSETGLHYNINRYYNPLTGRYMTPDPIGLEGGLIFIRMFKMIRLIRLIPKAWRELVSKSQRLIMERNNGIHIMVQKQIQGEMVQFIVMVN
jgi:RHS repeat-associated protein